MRVESPVLVRWRRAVAAKAVGWVDQVAPTENFLLDAAVEPAALERSPAGRCSVNANPS